MTDKISGLKNICNQLCPVIQENKDQGIIKVATFLEELK